LAIRTVQLSDKLLKQINLTSAKLNISNNALIVGAIDAAIRTIAANDEMLRLVMKACNCPVEDEADPADLAVAERARARSRQVTSLVHGSPAAHRAGRGKQDH